jgi:hypothetical protein
MPYTKTDDGIRLYFEETGSGRPARRPRTGRFAREIACAKKLIS